MVDEGELTIGSSTSIADAAAANYGDVGDGGGGPPPRLDAPKPEEDDTKPGDDDSKPKGGDDTKGGSDGPATLPDADDADPPGDDADVIEPYTLEAKDLADLGIEDTYLAPEAEEKITSRVRELGLNREQAVEVLKLSHELMNDSAAASQEAAIEQTHAWKAELEKEFGEDCSSKFGECTSLLKRYGGEEFFEGVKASGFSLQPQFVGFLLNVKNAIDRPRADDPTPTLPGGKQNRGGGNDQRSAAEVNYPSDKMNEGGGEMPKRRQ